MPGDEEEAAEDERRDDLRPADPVALAVAARERERQEDASGDEVPDRHREKRRQIANGDRERDERRAPDEVHRHEGKPNSHVTTRAHAPILPGSDHQLKSTSGRLHHQG